MLGRGYEIEVEFEVRFIYTVLQKENKFVPNALHKRIRYIHMYLMCLEHNEKRKAKKREIKETKLDILFERFSLNYMKHKYQESKK